MGEALSRWSSVGNMSFSLRGCGRFAEFSSKEIRPPQRVPQVSDTMGDLNKESGERNSDDKEYGERNSVV